MAFACITIFSGSQAQVQFPVLYLELSSSIPMGYLRHVFIYWRESYEETLSPTLLAIPLLPNRELRREQTETIGEEADSGLTYLQSTNND